MESLIIYVIFDKLLESIDSYITSIMHAPDRRLWAGRRFKKLHRAGSKDGTIDEIFTDGTIGEYVSDLDFYEFVATDELGVVEAGIHINDIISVEWVDNL